MPVEKAYQFEGPKGKASLFDLFDGRGQLVVYQFMDNGPDHYCPGCTWFTNNVPVTGLAGLAANGVPAGKRPAGSVSTPRTWRCMARTRRVSRSASARGPKTTAWITLAVRARRW